MEGREGERATEGGGGGIIASSGGYTLSASRFASEDIIFCMDIDNEALVEMKGTGTTTGRPFTRLDSIKQSILLFMHAKLSIHSDHRFAFTAIGKSTFWVFLLLLLLLIFWCF